jgi:PAS domain S-box-containing protein
MTITDPDSLRLAAIVQSSDDAIISTSTSGVIETWNRAAERIFGYAAGEAIGRSIGLIVPDDRLDEERALIARLRRGEVIHHFETTAITRTGARLHVSVSLSPVLTPDGDLIGIARIARDRTQQRLLEREAFRLAAIIDSSDDAIVSKDLNGVVQTWNRAAERMFGYTAAEMIGRPITMIIPADRLSEEDYVLSRIRSGLPVEHFETIRQRKDGSQVQVSLTISPIRTPSGRVIGASKNARDVSAQRSLEREAFRLAAIVDSSEDAIASKDLNGIVQTWNRAAERMFGYTASEIVGRSITTIIPPERLAEEDLVLDRIRSGRAVEHFETVRQRKDGSRIDISLTVSPIRTPDGRVIGASKIARDISPLRRLARELEQANRVKDEFLATLSHELRTPLNAVLGYTRMLRTGNVQPARAFEIIERNANVLSQLVSDVLDVSAIVTGKIAIKPAPCDLAAVLDAALDSVRPSAVTTGVALSVDHARPVPITGDADRLQQVFWNLLNNAVKFTPTGGRVDVRLDVEGDVAHASVSDTGIGIRPDLLPYVFQRFWQGESVNSRERGGLGLGLALARHFVELHGGTITASSDGEGRGATFEVMLPTSRPSALPG